MAHLIPLEGYLDSLGVPRTRINQLETFAERLVTWNERMNLIAGSTVPEMWRRHFWDSAQLYPLVPKTTRILVDLGSGAGFPGLVLAILGVPEVHLVESIGKKAEFLRAVAREVAPGVTVHNARAESLKELKADVVTARAVAALPELLGLARPFWKKETVGLFLKGEKAEAELTEARKYWTFLLEKTPSQTDKTGLILKIGALKPQENNGVKRKFRW